MAFLSRRSRISAAEREACIEYISNELGFRDELVREANRYFDAVENDGTELPDGHSIHAAARELRTRRTKAIPSAPEAVRAVWLLYGETYEAYESVAYSTAVTWTSVVPEGYGSKEKYISALCKRFEQVRKKADRKLFKDLWKRLRITPEEQTNMSIGNADDTQPESPLARAQLVRTWLAETDALLEYKGVEVAVLFWASWAAHEISDALELDGTSEDQWKLNVELLCFLLHYMSRRALAQGGQDFRANLQDYVVPGSIEKLIDSSWANSDGAWKERLFDSTLQSVNDAEEEYGQCDDLFPESSAAAFRSTDVLGRVSDKVVNLLGIDDFVVARTCVFAVLVSTLAGSKLHEAIDEAASAEQK